MTVALQGVDATRETITGTDGHFRFLDLAPGPYKLTNIGGNETGQPSNFASKGTRPQDAVWTIDGVVVTDMAATGASPTYSNAAPISSEGWPAATSTTTHCRHRTSPPNSRCKA